MTDHDILDTNAINAHFANRTNELLADIFDLVRLESPSADADRLRSIARRVAEDFAALGALVEIVDEHPHGPNLRIRVGTGARPILILGHLDTVWPVGTIETMRAVVEGDIARGPGIFDMKSSVVVLREALRYLATNGVTVDTTILLTCDEEIGSQSSRALLEREAGASRLALVLEPSLPGGGAKTSRSGVARYVVETHGRAAHAGVDPEKGVNAIVEMAHVVAQLDDLNDLANGLSVNTGTIGGGTRPNVVPADARIEVDVRFRTLKQAERVDDALRALQPRNSDARIAVSGGIERPPFERTEATMALYERAASAARAAGFDLTHGHVGGCSDGNLVAALGLPVLDGLGITGNGAHAVHEHIVIADVPRRAAMLTFLLADLMRDVE